MPTFSEKGYPKFTVAAWLSVLAPKGTPEPILRQLADATQAIVADPAFEQRLVALGAEPVAAGPVETAARMKAEQQLWQSLAR